MERYRNRSGESGIIAYEERSNGIVLQFANGGRYLYTFASSGREHVVAMKHLARRGRGLATYLNQHVGGNYATKLA
jgi:hypothetical protein